PRHDTRLPLGRVTPDLQHLVDEYRRAILGGFGSHDRAAPIQPLARDDGRLVSVRDPLVLAEHVSDLAAADPDVTRGYVGVFADVTVQLDDEALAEAHDLVVGLPLRVEIGAALSAPDRHPGQRVLED